MLKKSNIRLLNKKDFKGLEEFQKKYLIDKNNIWDEDDLNSFQTKENVYGLISEQKQKIQGFCLFSGTFDFFELYIIFVEPKFRRKGIAKFFLGMAVQFCQLNKIKAIHLEVNEKNFSAIKLYKSFNFKEVGVRENYYFVNGKRYDALKMKLCI